MAAARPRSSQRGVKRIHLAGPQTQDGWLSAQVRLRPSSVLSVPSGFLCSVRNQNRARPPPLSPPSPPPPLPSLTPTAGEQANPRLPDRSTEEAFFLMLEYKTRECGPTQRESGLPSSTGSQGNTFNFNLEASRLQPQKRGFHRAPPVSLWSSGDLPSYHSIGFHLARLTH